MQLAHNTAVMHTYTQFDKHLTGLIMKNNLSSILDEMAGQLLAQLELAKKVLSAIGQDAKDLAALGEEKLHSLIDRIAEDQTIRKMAADFFTNAAKGRDIAVSKLREQHARYEEKLNEMVNDKTEVVGFWDGFVSVFLATPAERKARSRIYTTHVSYGRVIGVITSLLLFIPAGAAGKLLGSLPVITRAAEYLRRKIREA